MKQKHKNEQDIQPKEPLPKTSPLQSMVSSVEDFWTSAKLTLEMKFVK